MKNMGHAYVPDTGSDFPSTSTSHHTAPLAVCTTSCTEYVRPRRMQATCRHRRDRVYKWGEFVPTHTPPPNPSQTAFTLRADTSYTRLISYWSCDCVSGQARPGLCNNDHSDCGACLHTHTHTHTYRHAPTPSAKLCLTGVSPR
jgi:hypothetical protein